MPKSIPAALKKLNHQPKIFPQYSLHKYTPIICRNKGTQQLATNDTLQLLSKKDIKYIQSITGTFLYHTRVLHYTMLPALNEIAYT